MNLPDFDETMPKMFQKHEWEIVNLNNSTDGLAYVDMLNEAASNLIHCYR